MSVLKMLLAKPSIVRHRHGCHERGAFLWEVDACWGEISSSHKVRCRTAHDLYCIENWSRLLDPKILFLTPYRLLNTKNAH